MLVGHDGSRVWRRDSGCEVGLHIRYHRLDGCAQWIAWSGEPEPVECEVREGGLSGLLSGA